MHEFHVCGMLLTLAVIDDVVAFMVLGFGSYDRTLSATFHKLLP